MTSRRLLPFVLCLALTAFAAAPVHASAPKKEGPKGDVFLVFDPFTVSVVERQRMRGLLVLEVVLQIPEAEAREKADTLKPRLRDGYVRTLMQFGATRAHVDRTVDITRIAATLQATTDGFLGAGQARVLITQALLRPMY